MSGAPSPGTRMTKADYELINTPAEQAAYWESRAKAKKTAKKTAKKKPATRNYVKKRGARGGYGGSMGCPPGNNIIYPNVVGRGAYYLGGGFGYDSDKGFTASGKGYITDQPVSGLGAYSIKKNSHMGIMDFGEHVPSVRNTNMGEAFVINHQEYLGDLYSGAFVHGSSATEFTLQSYNLNPGNSKMFPFLSSIARNFQEYEIRGMLVCLRSLASDYAGSVALGSIFAAADYNVYGDTPTSKVQIENMDYSESSKPSKSIIMPIECAPQNNGVIHKKVAINDEYHGGDKNNFDWAHLFIGSQGIPAEHTTLCEVHVTFEVAFFKPIINGNDPKDVNVWDGAAWRLTNNSSVLPLGSVIEPFGGNSSDITVDAITQKVKFPVMRRGEKDRHYLVFFEATSSTAGNFTLGTFAVSNLAPVLCMPFAGVASASNQAIAGWVNPSQRGIHVACYRAFASTTLTAVNPVLTFESGFNFSTGDRRGTLWVASLPANFDPLLLEGDHPVFPQTDEVIEIDCNNPELYKPSIASNPLFKDYVEEEVKRRVRELKRTTSC